MVFLQHMRNGRNTSVPNIYLLHLKTSRQLSSSRTRPLCQPEPKRQDSPLPRALDTPPFLGSICPPPLLLTLCRRVTWSLPPLHRPGLSPLPQPLLVGAGDLL